ncbi:MAG: AAA family ATPase [Candidatus Woesearchaeota archaeon]
MHNKKLVIGLTGTIASGKATIAELLKQKGFTLQVLSAIIADELRKEGREVVRTSLQDKGNDLRAKLGGQALVELTLKKHQSYSTPLVIDGIRNLDEINYLRKRDDIIFYLIGVDAPIETRWNRINKRNRDIDLLDHDKFILDDARDRGFNEPLNGQQVGMCLVQADFLINNDEDFTGPIEHSKLYKDMNEIYRKIMKK